MACCLNSPCLFAHFTFLNEQSILSERVQKMNPARSWKLLAAVNVATSTLILSSFFRLNFYHEIPNGQFHKSSHLLVILSMSESSCTNATFTFGRPLAGWCFSMRNHVLLRHIDFDLHKMCWNYNILLVIISWILQCFSSRHQLSCRFQAQALSITPTTTNSPRSYWIPLGETLEEQSHSPSGARCWSPLSRFVHSSC
jgi:hypothetical protein